MTDVKLVQFGHEIVRRAHVMRCRKETSDV